MSELARKVPEAVVLAHLGGIIAISPERYAKLLDVIAERCEVENDEAFREHVSEILRKNAPDPEDF